MKKKNKLIITGIFILLLIVVVLLAVMLVLSGRKEEESEGYVLDESNYLQIQDEMGAKVDAGYFETYMNTEWTFPDGTSETQDAILGNSSNNAMPIRCEVLLDETGEKVLSTGVLPVGAQMPPFKLEKDLDAGRYEATCMVYLLEETGDGKYTDYSSAGFRVTITVEN